MFGSPGIDVATVPRPTGALTPSRLFAKALADTMKPGEISRFDYGLQNIELAAERFRLSTTNEAHGLSTPGVSVMDTIAPGQVLIVYADARQRSGVGVAHPPLDALTAAIIASGQLTAAQRHRQLVERTHAMLPRNRSTADESDLLAAVAEDLLVIAGLLLSLDDLQILRSMNGAIPALAIVARTDARGRRSVDTRHITTRFPGDYFGTGTPAGGG